MPEVWERQEYICRPGCTFIRNVHTWNCPICGTTAVTRTLTYDERDNVTLTRAEVEGLLRLAHYEKRTA